LDLKFKAEDMAQQSFAGVAMLVAVAFAIMALKGCASPGQSTAATVTAAIPEPAFDTPEFHDAPIGRDELRSRLDS
jgi:hypothetical protein